MPTCKIYGYKIGQLYIFVWQICIVHTKYRGLCNCGTLYGIWASLYWLKWFNCVHYVFFICHFLILNKGGDYQLALWTSFSPHTSPHAQHPGSLYQRHLELFRKQLLWLYIQIAAFNSPFHNFCNDNLQLKSFFAKSHFIHNFFAKIYSIWTFYKLTTPCQSRHTFVYKMCSNSMRIHGLLWGYGKGMC